MGIGGTIGSSGRYPGEYAGGPVFELSPRSLSSGGSSHVRRLSPRICRSRSLSRSLFNVDPPASFSSSGLAACIALASRDNKRLSLSSSSAPVEPTWLWNESNPRSAETSTSGSSGCCVPPTEPCCERLTGTCRPGHRESNTSGTGEIRALEKVGVPGELDVLSQWLSISRTRNLTSRSCGVALPSSS